MFSDRVVTLSIEDDGVRIVTVKGNRVEKWGNIPLAPGVVKDGSIIEPAGIGSAVKGLLALQKATGNKVIASLSGLRSIPRILTLPRMPKKLMNEAVTREAELAMPVSLDELYLSWQVIATKAEEQHVFLLGVPRDLIDAEVQALHQVQLNPYLIDLKPMALTRAVSRKEALIIDIEHGSFDIIVVADFVPVIMRTITPSRELITLEDRIRAIADEFWRTVKFYESTQTSRPLDLTTPVFLSGEMANDPIIAERLQGMLEYPIAPLLPPLKCPPNLPIPQYAVNIGLALKELPQARGFQGVNLNLLPEIYQPRRRTMKQLAPYFTVVVIAGLLFPLYQATDNAADKTEYYRSQLAQANQQLEQRRQHIKQATELQAAINQVLAAAENIAEERQTILSWGQFTDCLELVTNLALAHGCELKSISETSDAIKLAGQASGYSNILSYTDALRETGEFSSVTLGGLSKAGEGEGESATASFSLTIAK